MALTGMPAIHAAYMTVATAITTRGTPRTRHARRGGDGGRRTLNDSVTALLGVNIDRQT